MLVRKIFICTVPFLLIESCASNKRRDKVVAPAENYEEPRGPSAASLLDRVPDRNDQKMSQVFLTTTKNGKKTTQTWCEGISNDNEPLIKRELTKSGLCFRKICEDLKCEEIGNPQIPKRGISTPQTKTARSI